MPALGASVRTHPITIPKNTSNLRRINSAEYGGASGAASCLNTHIKNRSDRGASEGASEGRCSEGASEGGASEWRC